MKKELPDNLTYLPLYVLGLLKHRVSCKDELERKLDIDLSNYMRIKIQKLNLYDVMAFIYPRIYPIHSILDDNTLGNFDENSNVILPQIVSTYYGSLDKDGLYLIDNGYLLILYTKQNVSKTLLNSLFNVNDLSEFTATLLEDNIFSETNEIKTKISNIIDSIRGAKSLFQNLIFVFEGTDHERIIKECLIEDNFCPWMGVDYRTFYTNNVEVNSTGYYKQPALK